jgi:hypothetical protein
MTMQHAYASVFKCMFRLLHLVLLTHACCCMCASLSQVSRIVPVLAGSCSVQLAVVLFDAHALFSVRCKSSSTW